MTRADGVRAFGQAEFDGHRIVPAGSASVPYGGMSSALRPGSAPRCPVAHGVEFDPLSASAAADPMPWLRAAQHGAPVFYLPGYDLWCVTRYDDAIEVLRDPGSYSSRKT